jgi:hypothetical protein
MATARCVHFALTRVVTGICGFASNKTKNTNQKNNPKNTHKTSLVANI